METSIRVLVANRPRLLRELVLSTLSEQEGISIVGEAEHETGVPSLVAETKPDFLLIALDESRRRPVLCDQLLKKFPGLRIIAVAPNTNMGIFYWASLEIFLGPISRKVGSEAEEVEYRCLLSPVDHAKIARLTVVYGSEPFTQRALRRYRLGV